MGYREIRGKYREILERDTDRRPARDMKKFQEENKRRS
jgi:hypothetical protein